MVLHPHSHLETAQSHEVALGAGNHFLGGMGTSAHANATFLSTPESVLQSAQFLDPREKLSEMFPSVEIKKSSKKSILKNAIDDD